MNPNWVQDASYEVCVEQCGQMCCTTPTIALPLTHDEARLLFRGDGNTIFRTRITPASGGEWRTAETNHVYYLYDDQPGKKCMHSTPTGCDIYEDRPQACRSFPTAPTPQCLLWPVLAPSSKEGVA